MKIGCVVAVCLLFAATAQAETIRIATYNAGLSRSGPGLLADALQRGDDAQISAVLELVAAVQPDILLINEFDYDFAGVAAAMFRDALLRRGVEVPYLFAGPVNSGVPSRMDLDGDGASSGPGDAFGYGRFRGAEGMLLLSAYPIDEGAVRTFGNLRWVDFPGAILPKNSDGSPFPTAPAQSSMRLSSKSHWDVPVRLPDGTELHVLASHPTPPVFDGPEDRNGRRNHDEIRFWALYLDGYSFTDDAGNRDPRSKTPFVLLGDLNSDPLDGDSRHDAIRTLLASDFVQDPKPSSQGALEAARAQMGANETQSGRADLDTADWNDRRGPGNLRVDYVLPSSDLSVKAAGIFWPAADDPQRGLIEAGGKRRTRHRLVWVDINFR